MSDHVCYLDSGLGVLSEHGHSLLRYQLPLCQWPVELPCPVWPFWSVCISLHPSVTYAAKRSDNEREHDYHCDKHLQLRFAVLSLRASHWSRTNVAVSNCKAGRLETGWNC